MINKEIIRVTQKIPNEDRASQSFINKRTSKMIEEISKTKTSSKDK